MSFWFLMVWAQFSGWGTLTVYGTRQECEAHSQALQKALDIERPAFKCVHQVIKP